MRRAEELPYDWLADNTRWQRKPRTFNRVEQALRDIARFYRKALWADAASYVEIRVEKDALPFTHRRLPIYRARHIGRLHAFNNDAHHHLMKDDSPRDEP